MIIMDETRLLASIEAYGGNPGSWPETERDLATMLGEAAVAPATLALQTRIAGIMEQSII